MTPPPYPAAYHRAHAALVARHPNPRPLIAAALAALDADQANADHVARFLNTPTK